MRLPGQWTDPSWEDATLGVELYQNVNRWLEVGTARFLRPDPIGLDAKRRMRFGGSVPNMVFAYADDDPVGRTDPLGLTVWRCRRPADLPVLGRLGIPHQWLRTDTAAGGMGPAGGRVPGHGGCDCPFSRTEVVDHSRETGPNVTCEVVGNIDEGCVNRMIKPGGSTGRWFPMLNDCWTFVGTVIDRCRTDRPFNPGLPGWRQNPLGG